MDCPYLEVALHRECGAVTNKPEHATPASMGFDEYCLGEEHYRCPIVLARALRHSAGNA